MECWANCSQAKRCWLWTDVGTRTSSPRPWTPCSFEQRHVVLRHSDTQRYPPTVFTRQQCVTISTQAWWDLEIRSSRGPGGGHDSITWHASRQAAVVPTGWQMCLCVTVCIFLHHHVGLNSPHTASASRAQFDLCQLFTSADNTRWWLPVLLFQPEK